MVPLASLWLPIAVATLLVFFASFLIWGVLNLHWSDWKPLPAEDPVREALSDPKPAPGQYAFPLVSTRAEMSSPDFQKKLEGPVGFLIVVPSGPTNTGVRMGSWLAMCLAITVLVAYLAGRSLGPGADYLAVFQVVGTAAILGYAGSLAQGAIWFGRTWSGSFREIADGLLYGLLTAGVFGWLWP